MNNNYKLILILMLTPLSLLAQVTIRDTIVNWQHHAFELNPDYSMLWYTTEDTEIDQVQFEGKVLENELIRLVVLPEYGARVISFVYKPTGFEYLYQSECGSPYGIDEGNFYYDWLMVYGGIFPTFPEPEHGKTWLLPWDFTVLKQTNDTLTIRMEHTDNSSFSGAPGGFNNGITLITCQVDISIYQNQSIWDFMVRLINNQNNEVNYEYWTCATLTPGSEVGNTGSPLNTEMSAPVEQYEAGWSPGGWIGNWGQLYAFENINFLSEWDDMGIAYAHELNDNFWGVINHNNSEGIFRISDNIETPGMKFWTWGKDNIDNNLYDFSNGGADNYIELWAGNSLAFFEDAYLSPNQQLAWNESYVATSGMSGITAINNELAIFASISELDHLELELNKFKISDGFEINVTIAEENLLVLDQTYSLDNLLIFEDIDLTPFNLENGYYTCEIIISKATGGLLLATEIDIEITTTTIAENYFFDFKIQSNGNREILLDLTELEHFEVYLTDIMGRVVDKKNGHRTTASLRANIAGIYLINIQSAKRHYSTKIMLNE